MSAPNRVPLATPELLAPAGDESALAAALHAGADAVYFGLSEGFNARARAGNFSLANLADTVARIHRAGARAYLTLNTLVFESELAFVQTLLRRVALSGVDALIVQDPAVARLARELCPELELHASTQMTISSPEAARFAASLGITRVVVPRELSIDEIRAFARGTELELEVFVHGALCVAWSGQCLSSSLWNGRSANRGECAQSCRMPYDLLVDGAHRPLGDVKYLLSPKDLAGLRAVEALAAIGVHGLKIEGRQKGPQYVLTATETYRHWLDALALDDPSTVDSAPKPDADTGDVRRRDAPAGAARSLDELATDTLTSDAPRPVSLATHALTLVGERATAERDLLRANLSYTRGVSDGFLGGSDHQTLVEGRFPKHRGVYLGRVVRVGRDWVEVERDSDGRPWTGALAAEDARGEASGAPAAALHGFGGSACASDGPRAAPLEPRAGLGVVFDAGDPEDKHEPGGPIFRVDVLAHGWRFGFGTPGPKLARVAPGQRVWASGDPALASEAEAAVAAAEPSGRNALTLVVSGRAGAPLAVAAHGMRGVAAHLWAALASNLLLERAKGAGLGRGVLVDKLAAFGGTPFRLAELDASGLEPGLHLPVSELKALRRALVAQLVPQLERGPQRRLRELLPQNPSLQNASPPAQTPCERTPCERTPCERTPCDQTPCERTPGEQTQSEQELREQTLPEPVQREREPRARGRTEGGFRLVTKSDTITNRNPFLVALCRTDAQLEAAIEAGVREVELDWMELVGLGRAVERARAAQLTIGLATLRVHKPGEQGYDQRLEALAPDAVLVRHWAALVHFDAARANHGGDAVGGATTRTDRSADSRVGRRVALHGDFSLNVANSITARELFARGLDTLTPAHDLDREQLYALLSASEPTRFTIVLQHRMPTFHTEHCVYAHLLSNGRDHRTCGRPCEQHQVALRDTDGRAHEVIVDVGCRNTVFDATAQSAAEAVPQLLALGVRRFRVEFVREGREEARRALSAYRKLLAAELTPHQALEQANALGRVGVADAMELMR
jgi:collagenase-like PrtC family protease